MVVESEPKKFTVLPAKERLISEIEQTSDSRIAVMGTIVEKNDDSSSIIIDDGEKQIGIIVMSDFLLDSLKVGKLVRVLGSLFKIEGIEQKELEMRGEIIQDMTGLNFELYKKVHNFTKEKTPSDEKK